MKNFITILLILTIALSVAAIAQPYVRAGLGYGLSLGSQYIGTNYTVSGTTTNYEGVYGSFGAGLNFGAAFGYSFTSNFKGELGVSYVLGNEYEVTDKSTNEPTTDKIKCSMFSITPGMIIMTDAGDIKPYAKLGLVIAFPQMTEEYEYYSEHNKYVKKVEASGNIAIGFTGGGGLFYPINDQLMLFGEVSFTNIAWEPAEADISSNEPGYMNHTVKYKREYSSTDLLTSDSEPKPLGSVGLNIGVLINF